VLRLANAWNVKSAQRIEKARFEAITAWRGAIVKSLGYDDGEKMSKLTNGGALLYSGCLERQS